MPQRPSLLPPLPPLTMAEAAHALQQIADELLAWANRDGLTRSQRARLLRIANIATRALARVPNPPPS